MMLTFTPFIRLTNSYIILIGIQSRQKRACEQNTDTIMVSQFL